jgi:hypothetical protein
MPPPLTAVFWERQSLAGDHVRHLISRGLGQPGLEIAPRELPPGVELLADSSQGASLRMVLPAVPEDRARCFTD